MNSLELSTGMADADEIVVWIWVLTAIVCLGFHFVLIGGFFTGMAGIRAVKSTRDARRKRRQQSEVPNAKP